MKLALDLPTDCSDETRRLKIARRFGSAMISKTDSTLFIYPTEHMLVKAYKDRVSVDGPEDIPPSRWPPADVLRAPTTWAD